MNVYIQVVRFVIDKKCCINKINKMFLRIVTCEYRYLNACVLYEDLYGCLEECFGSSMSVGLFKRIFS